MFPPWLFISTGRRNVSKHTDEMRSSLARAMDPALDEAFAAAQEIVGSRDGEIPPDPDATEAEREAARAVIRAYGNACVADRIMRTGLV